MNGNTASVGKVHAFTLGFMLWASGLALAASEANITRTNWSERWITNVIEVTMPVNRFVNEYRTNWVTQLRTNLLDVYATNQVTRTETNQVTVDAIQTNFAVAFRTNWTMHTITNPQVVEALWTNIVVTYRTNRITKTQVNPVSVTVLQTNFVSQYQTNWSTLNVTNWETVVMFKTNRVTLPVTNVVQVNVAAEPAAPAAAREAVAPEPDQAKLGSPGPAVAWKGPLAIEAARTARPPADNLVEVQIRVRRNGGSSAPVQVQSWRIEREDGVVFLFGQDQEFKRQLPLGNYKVEVRLKGEADNPPLVARGTLSVTAREAVIQPRLLVKK